MVSSQFRTSMALALFYRNRVRLGAIVAKEPVANAVVTVRRKIRREVMKRPGLVKEVVLDDAIGIARPGRIQTHLQVLVINLNVMKGELHVGEHAQIARLLFVIPDLYVPKFDVVFQRNE